MENRNILHGIFAISGHMQEFGVIGQNVLMANPIL